MKLLEQTAISLEWADINGRVRHPYPVNHPRSPGVHLSGVLRYIAIQSGILVGVDPTTGKWTGDQTRTSAGIQDVDDEIMPLRMAMGMAWEEWVVGLYPDMLWQPGEFHRDKVYGTPDGLIVNQSGQVDVEEVKLTWKSEHTYGKGTDFLRNWMWTRQVMGYMAMLQAEGYEVSRLGRFHIGWANGDYRPPSPKYIRYLVEFEQKEIDRTWEMVLKNRDKDGVKREC